LNVSFLEYLPHLALLTLQQLGSQSCTLLPLWHWIYTREIIKILFISVIKENLATCVYCYSEHNVEWKWFWRLLFSQFPRREEIVCVKWTCLELLVHPSSVKYWDWVCKKYKIQPHN
jgi:hypothetical protein